MKKKQILLSVIFMFILFIAGFTSVSFAKEYDVPVFDSTYAMPQVCNNTYTVSIREYIDVLLLILFLMFAGISLIKFRSRLYLFFTMIGSLVYFGFIRHGCICPVGSIQNVLSHFFTDSYTIPISVLLFFLIPLIAALFWGRIFCAGVCPLGAIQDILLFKSIRLPRILSEILKLIPYFYLFLVIVVVLRDNSFILCKLDPFVCYFRLTGTPVAFVVGGVFLLISMFIGRPFCRFLCPYGLLLNWLSRFSKKHVKITPEACINCRLCEDSCPYEAIRHPNLQELPVELHKKGKIYLKILLFIIPLWMTLFGIIGKQQFYNKDIQKQCTTLNKNLTHEKDAENIDMESIHLLEKRIRDIDRKKMVAIIFGVLFGLALGIHIAGLSIHRTQTDFEPHKGYCFSCGRCLEYCPIEIKCRNIHDKTS